MQSQDIPYGFCYCGCGEKTRVLKYGDSSKKGWVAGRPLKYIAGHKNRPAPRPQAERRFWAKVRKGDLCWVWTGATTAKQDGYGWAYFDGRMQTAHRVAYELTHGPIPEGLHIDHLCRNKRCVNPDHLEPVTVSENALRGVGGVKRRLKANRKTHCSWGHELTPENTYWRRANTSGNWVRICRTCQREWMRRWRELVRSERIGA